METLIATSILLGAAVGLVQALTGAGGAILAVPLLLFGLHLDMLTAAPVALLAVALSAAVGAALGLRAGIVRYRAAFLLAVAGMIFAPAGLWLAQRIPNAPLTLLFAAVLAWVTWRMLRQAGADKPAPLLPLPPSPCQLDDRTGRIIWTVACARILALAGGGAGFLSGLLGVGGGFVIVPTLKRATNAPMDAIVATSLAVITLISSAAVISMTLAGRMNWQIGIPFAAGAMLAMLGGRRLAGRISGQRLQQGFAVMAGLIALGLVVKVALAT